MSDFTSDFWGWFIAITVIISIAACFWLVMWMTTKKDKSQEGTTETMGHVWDENLEELNNPLPRLRWGNSKNGQ